MVVIALIASLGFASLSLASLPVVTSMNAKCPDADGSRIVTGNGTYVVECGIDRSDNDIGSIVTASFGKCVDACAADSACVQVSFRPDNSGHGYCYFKSGHGYPNVDSSIWGARQDDGLSSKISDCPQSDGAIYRAMGKIFQVSCGVDRRGGDIGGHIYTNLVGCIEACASTPGCVDVTLSGTACYLKNNLTTAEFNDAFQGAQLIGKYDATTTQVSTTFVAPLPTAAGIRCPDSNNAIIPRPCGSVYKIECDVDHYGNNLPGAVPYVYSLDACIHKCDLTTGCKDVSWIPGNPGACYLKSAISAAQKPSNPSGTWGARQLQGCEGFLSVAVKPSVTLPSIAHVN